MGFYDLGRSQTGNFRVTQLTSETARQAVSCRLLMVPAAYGTLSRVSPGLLLLTLTLVAPQTATQPFRATIEGVVRDAATDAPLAGVNVYALPTSLRAPQRDSAFIVTNTQGEFRIDIRQAGRYRLVPQRDGFVYARPAHLRSLHAGVVVDVVKEAVRVELPMTRDGKITGKVVDPAGRPIPGVRMNLFTRAYGSDGKPAWAPLGPMAQPSPNSTNDQGDYRFFGLQPGDYIVGAFDGPFSNRYHPGVERFSAANPIHIDAGEEARVSPMVVTPAPPTVRVRLSFRDPERKFTMTGLSMALDDGILGFGSGFGPTSTGEIREIRASLPRGRHEAAIYARSSANDLLFASLTLDVGDEEIDREVQLTPGTPVAGSLLLKDKGGATLNTEGIRCALYSDSYTSVAASGSPGCIGGQYEPGFYTLQMASMPPDAYVLTATSGQRNVLADGIQIERDARLDIVLATPGAVISGKVIDDMAQPLSHAVVALVPDAPLHHAAPLYRSDISTYDGTFELRGIAPGSYHLFAWADTPGNAYRNAEFMKQYEGKGVPIVLESATSLSMDLKALE